MTLIGLGGVGLVVGGIALAVAQGMATHLVASGTGVMLLLASATFLRDWLRDTALVVDSMRAAVVTSYRGRQTARRSWPLHAIELTARGRQLILTTPEGHDLLTSRGDPDELQRLVDWVQQAKTAADPLDHEGHVPEELSRLTHASRPQRES